MDCGVFHRLGVERGEKVVYNCNWVVEMWKKVGKSGNICG